MKTVKIRDVRGPLLEELARERRLVGITSNRVLVAVLLPVTGAWVESLIEANLSRLEQNVKLGERELATGSAESLDDLVASSAPEDALLAPAAHAEARVSSHVSPGRTSVAGVATRGLASIRTAMRLGSGSANPSQMESPQPPPPMQAVRIGDLSGALIEEAGSTGQTLAVTNGGVLVGVLVPVTQQLVEHLVDQNMSRILWNIAEGELEATSGASLTNLDDLVPAESGNGGSVFEDEQQAPLQ